MSFFKNIIILYLCNRILFYELNNVTCKIGPCWTGGSISKNKNTIYIIFLLIFINFILSLSYIIYKIIDYMYYKNKEKEKEKENRIDKIL